MAGTEAAGSQTNFAHTGWTATRLSCQPKGIRAIGLSAIPKTPSAVCEIGIGETRAVLLGLLGLRLLLLTLAVARCGGRPCRALEVRRRQ